MRTLALTCTAAVNGCDARLVLDITVDVDVSCLCLDVAEDRRVAELLAANGWWCDHGRWVCGRHPRPIPIRRRDPAEVRALILASPLPPELAAALAAEVEQSSFRFDDAAPRAAPGDFA